MAKSYFAILGVSTGASSDEIRSAYRRLVKEFHPDHYNGGSTTFRRIQEAYSILGDERRRAEYEESLQRLALPRTGNYRPYPEPEPLIPESRAADLGEISPIRSFQTFTPSFDELFDWLWSNFSGIDRPKFEPLQNLTLEVPLTRTQAATGGNARIMVPSRAVCPTCRGEGGMGYYECPRCAGEGAVTGEIPVSIAFPPGLTMDHAVVIPLQRFGIRNLQFTIVFRPTGAN